MSDERTSLLLNPESNPNIQDTGTQEKNSVGTATESYLYDSMFDQDINDISSSEKPELITLLGLSSCGKTTFVGSLYALLRRRPELLGVTFLDSDTLTGFEKRVYLRRIKGDNKSAVKRTLRSDGNILNIIVSDKTNKQRMLLISDKAGESYGDVIDHSDEAIKHLAVKYANKLVLFLDSDEIIKRYSSYKDKILTLLNVFKNASMLPTENELITVFNKIDMVSSSSEISKEDWDEREKALLEIVDKFFSARNSVYRINSLGIEYGKEHEGLISLYKHLLSPEPQTSLTNEYNWITKLTRSSK